MLSEYKCARQFEHKNEVLVSCTGVRKSCDMGQENKAPKTMQLYVTWRCTSLIITHFISKFIYTFYIMCAYSIMMLMIVITIDLSGLLKLN